MSDEMETIVSSFLFTFLAIKALKPIADKVGLLDTPNYRKHHQGAVPPGRTHECLVFERYG